MADPPPSYNEVINNPSAQKGGHYSATPTAPRLEAIITNPEQSNAQGSQPSHGVHNDGRFSAWDDRATEMLIMNRLEMNERFERAQNQQERDELWDIILNQLIAAGYNFARIELIQFWEYEFYIYKSIVNNLSAGTQSDSNWKYFAPMDNVFKYTSGTGNLRSSGEEDFAAAVSSPVTNTFGGLTNLGSISDPYSGVQGDAVITSQPNPVLKIPGDNSDVVTTQPSSFAHGYVPITQSGNRNDDGDCCCCCIGCCDENNGGYSDRTGGYSGRSDNYNNFSHTDHYATSGFTLDDNYTSGHTNNDDVDCGTGGGGNDDGCCDSGGGGNDSCWDSGGGGDDGCCDSGGGGDDGGCCDSGGGGCDD